MKVLSKNEISKLKTREGDRTSTKVPQKFLKLILRKSEKQTNREAGTDSVVMKTIKNERQHPP